MPQQESKALQQSQTQTRQQTLAQQQEQQINDKFHPSNVISQAPPGIQYTMSN